MNVYAIVVAAVSSFLLGGLWYSPAVFGKAWNQANGGVPVPGHPGRVFGVSLLFCLLAATAFAWLLGPAPALSRALLVALVVGGGMVAASFGVNYQFSQRSLRLWLIDGGYHLFQFLLFAVVLGLWH
ncbi:DUF1761 domain-containing protein [Stenotrophomonas koreensis]|uniref:DUF1761 domain-containing protein n=1 Tax=Stenotrophomonas koreensis TaxID=266128 RepID=UPI003396BD70